MGGRSGSLAYGRGRGDAVEEVDEGGGELAILLRPGVDYALGVRCVLRHEDVELAVGDELGGALTDGARVGKVVAGDYAGRDCDRPEVGFGGADYGEVG